MQSGIKLRPPAAATALRHHPYHGRESHLLMHAPSLSNINLNKILAKIFFLTRDLCPDLRRFMSKKKNNYLIQVTIQNETVQKHPARQDRQLHPDGHHRLRIHLPHAVVQELEGVGRSKRE
jgi:hypothetical protein